VKAFGTALLGGLKTTFIGGVSLFWLAPMIPLLIMLPEFVQHIYEINAGMFASKAAFNAQAMDPARWAFGYAKIAGLVLAIFAAARYWGGARERWWDLRNIAWKPFLIALAINIAVTLALEGAKWSLGERTPAWLDPVFAVASVPLLLMLIGPLLGDAGMTLRRAYTSGWLQALMVGVLFLLAGFLVSVEVFEEIRIPFTHVVLRTRRRDGRRAEQPGQGGT